MPLYNAGPTNMVLTSSNESISAGGNYIEINSVVVNCECNLVTESKVSTHFKRPEGPRL